ncbi:MAG: response regulator, partial [Candidatus Brocadiales bacterium]|nr:response regulator [Candidatus Brocadiales bacterium]
DDNEDHCDGIKEYLEHEGYAVGCSNSGADAITLSHSNRYNIALVDIGLPDMQGTDLVMKLADISPSMEFIHITAHATLDSAIDAVRQEQVVSYETKPLDMEHLLAILVQIMKRKKLEEALLQSEKLKSIGTITAGISHEFNNILAIISGNVQLLEQTYKDHKELSDALRMIKEATNDGAEISNKMLEFTKTEVDTTKYAINDLSDLIQQSIKFTMPRWRNMAQTNGINYHIDIEGIKEISKVCCNSSEIREVFINIIHNSIDAMPDGGTISFSTCNKDGAVFVSISDTGKGMTEDVKKKVFDPFFTTRRPEGTGLGMSIVYSILSRHNGKIEVESAIGKGSTFTLQLPIATSADITREISETKEESKSNGLHILVVDDEESICDILEKFISSKGHMVRTADNGAEAIILAENCSYDLVLCDIVMPDIFGYDVIKALNALERRPKIGIITGWGEQLKPMEDDAYKVDFMLKKPFDFSEMTRLINNEFNDI